MPTIRLYRGQFAETRKGSAKPTSPSDDMQSALDMKLAGSWFTASKAVAEQYRPKPYGRFNQERSHVVFVDIPAEEAEIYRATNLPPEIRRLSGEPDVEYILPPHWVNRQEELTEPEIRPQAKRGMGR